MRSRALTLAAALLALPAAAKPPELQGRVQTEHPAGCHDYGFMLWDLNRAELWTDAERLPGNEFALSLTYRTDFTCRKLVESSIDEMARLSGRPAEAFDAVRQELADAFRDVAEGDRITAWRAGPDRLRFFVNGIETGALTRKVGLFLDI